MIFVSVAPVAEPEEIRDFQPQLLGKLSPQPRLGPFSPLQAPARQGPFASVSQAP